MIGMRSTRASQKHDLDIIDIYADRVLSGLRGKWSQQASQRGAKGDRGEKEGCHRISQSLTSIYGFI